MQQFGQIFRNMTAAAIMPLAAGVPASAAQIDEMLGRWSADNQQDCAYADNSEAAPLSVTSDGQGYQIGNYGWSCGVEA